MFIHACNFFTSDMTSKNVEGVGAEDTFIQDIVENLDNQEATQGMHAYICTCAMHMYFHVYVHVQCKMHINI